MTQFTHLHTHSHFSLLNALPKIPDLVARAKADGQTSLALTDDGNMYGTVEFYKTCKANDIKPIIGVDFYVATRTRHEKVSGIDNRRYRVILLATNYEGYKNLMRLTSLAYTEGFYYKPRIDHELLEQYKENLVCIIPQFSGETSAFLRINDTDRVNESIDFYKKTFQDKLYLEILHHPELPEQMQLREKIVALSQSSGVPLVATGDLYYLDEEDRAARDVLVDVGNVKSGGGNREEIDFSFHNQNKIHEFFVDYPEAISNTQIIADLCDVEIPLGEWTFPTFDIPDGRSAEEVLREMAYAGFASRNIEVDDVYKTRVEYELGVINTKGYDVYFLVVADLMRYAKENEILTNTRGSAAGCLVSYLVGITNIDPIEYKLPFERFLNPERPSAPDVDMDIADDKRDELISYAREKYGHDQVAQIGTFGTMAARGSVKDAARAMGYDYKMGDQISKLIPMGAQGFPMTIKRALEEEPDLKKLYKQDKEVRAIVDMAQKIEGSARHISIHAAGVVIAPATHNGHPTTINDFTPVQLDPKGSGKVVTQYNMHAVEDAGLLKYDFLGLKNLTVLYEAIKRIRKTRKVEINLDTLPLDDELTFSNLARGNTYGVFQLAGEGMTKWIKELKPTTIHDINAMVALYRPGPMEFIPEYIKRKYNPRLITHLHPKLGEILNQSFGVITYQDDVMMIAIEMAGYTWLEADKFRKAMGKKIPELMKEQEEKFYKGCLEYGLAKNTIDKLWENIETFAAYGFNKSHAAAYGNVAYKTAYLKANYPAEYMAALMTADSGNNENIARAVAECKVMGIPVLPPDVNESFADFSVVVAGSPEGKDQIRFGLQTIKNFGENITHAVIQERKSGGVFTSLEDFLTRVKSKDFNKKSLEALTLSGAFDNLEDRNLILANIENILGFIKQQRDMNVSQGGLFDSLSGEASFSALHLSPLSDQHIALKTGMAEELHYLLPMTDKDKLFWEKELLGLYVSGHPLEKYRAKIEQKGKNIRGAKAKGFQQNYMFAGVLSQVRHIMTKNNRKMAFATLSDTTDSLDVTFFSDGYKKYVDLIKDDVIVQVKGKLQKRDGEWNMVIDEMKELPG